MGKNHRPKDRIPGEIHESRELWSTVAHQLRLYAYYYMITPHSTYLYYSLLSWVGFGFPSEFVGKTNQIT